MYPSDRFSRIQFDKLLFARDGTGVPANPPRRQNEAEHRLASGADRNDPSISTFEVKVGRDGLVGGAALF